MAIKQYCGRRQNEIIDMKKKQKKGTLNGIEELEDAKNDGMKYCEIRTMNNYTASLWTTR